MPISISTWLLNAIRPKTPPLLDVFEDAVEIPAVRRDLSMLHRSERIVWPVFKNKLPSAIPSDKR